MRVNLGPSIEGDRLFEVEDPPMSGALITMYDQWHYSAVITIDKPAFHEEVLLTTEGFEIDEEQIRTAIADDEQVTKLIVGFAEKYFSI